MESERGPYQEARDLVERMCGSVEWRSGGPGGGGQWELELHGRRHTIPVRPPYEPNDFDRLYVPNVPEPKSHRDFGGEGGHDLQPDAFWRLIGYFVRDACEKP